MFRNTGESDSNLGQSLSKGRRVRRPDKHVGHGQGKLPTWISLIRKRFGRFFLFVQWNHKRHSGLYQFMNISTNSTTTKTRVKKWRKKL